MSDRDVFLATPGVPEHLGDGRTYWRFITPNGNGWSVEAPDEQTARDILLETPDLTEGDVEPLSMHNLIELLIEKDLVTREDVKQKKDEIPVDVAEVAVPLEP